MDAKKIVAKLATKYGTVTSGKYEGCQVALGNDPNKKVSVSYTFEQVVFFKDGEEKGRLNISLTESFNRLTITKEIDNGFHCVLEYADGDISEIDIDCCKAPGGIFGFFYKIGSLTNPPSADEKFKNKYGRLVTFFSSFALIMDSDTFESFKKYLATIGASKNEIKLWDEYAKIRKDAKLD